MTWREAIELLKRVKLIVGMLAVIVGILWAGLAEPRISSKINAKTDPLKDAITYQNYLMMESMSDTAIESATKKYLYLEKGIVR